MRSMRGPESLARYFSIARWLTSSRAICPLGVGLSAPTSMKRAGKRTEPCEREIVTHPSSSGWRNVSRTPRANSGISSRKSTPR